ncbi:porin family protein [Massilia luteola]|uniref:porin family protein n=1 Tax=Massilia luteola TaxID=3081751 RepID=UPI002ACBDB11|nr:porin family protein [Massilia sp. Gc5]
MKAFTFVLAAAALAAGTAAHAQQSMTASDTASYHPYVGIGVASAGNVTTGSRHADAKIFGGVDFSNNLGVEAGYVKFSSRDSHFSEAQTGFPGGVISATKGYGAYVAAKYTVPINDRFSAYGKLGVSHNERKYTSNVGFDEDIDNGVYAGLGAQYKLNEKLSLVGEYEQYGKGKQMGARAGVWSAGLKFGF